MFENGLSLETSGQRRLRPPAPYLGPAQAPAISRIDLGAENQMALELRPAHDPTKAYGFVCTVLSTKTFSAGIWLWHRENGNAKWAARKVIEFPPSPPTRICCHRRSSSSRPRRHWLPKLRSASTTSSSTLHAGGPASSTVRRERCVSSTRNGLGADRRDGLAARLIPRPARSMALPRCWRSAATAAASTSLTRFTRRSTISSIPRAFTDGSLKSTSNPAGGIALDPDFFIPFEGERPHQIHLEGGDCSSDSFCYP